MSSPDYVESAERKKAFNRELERLSGPNMNVVIFPSVYLKPRKGNEGNATHLIHDSVGIRVQTDIEGFIRGLVPPSKLSTIREGAEEDYILEAFIQHSSENKEVIKN